MTEKFDIPFQVQSLIVSLLNKNERVHVRGNYRMRLDAIKQAIDQALVEYDLEMGAAPERKVKNNGRS